jgi:hypothetical protein
MLGPVCAQVIRQTKIPASGRKFPALIGRSGTQRARRLLLCTAFGTLAPWSSSSPSDLRTTSVSHALLAEFNARASFRFAGCCLWRSLAVDGGSGTSRGHVRNARTKSRPAVVSVRRPLPHRTDCCRYIHRRGGVKGRLAYVHQALSPVLVALRSHRLLMPYRRRIIIRRQSGGGPLHLPCALPR